MKKSFIPILILIIGGIIFSQYNKPQEDKKPLVIIHQGSWFGDAPFYLAQEKGIFAKNGVEVKIQKVEEPQVRRQLLSSGQADISAETIDMAILDIGSGVQEKIFMALDTSLGADGIIASKEIKDITDLKGKKAGATKGDPPYFLLKYLLKEKGIGSESIDFQDMPNADTAGTAFLSGELDAAGTWEPWLSKASERSGGHVLVSSKDAPGVIVDVAVARPEVIVERNKEVKAIIKSWFEAIEYWKNNPDESNTIMAKEFNLSKEEFAGLVKTIRWDNRESNQTYFGTKESEGKAFEVTQKIIDIALEDKMISTQLKAEDLIDLTPLKNIQ